MKRIVSLFLAGLMLLAAAACVAKQQDAQTEAPTAAPVKNVRACLFLFQKAPAIISSSVSSENASSPI